MIPHSFIQDLLNRVDIVDVVGGYVPLKKAGANMLGLCPFHGEKTPSFTVSPTKQFYHCFGCGQNGTAISFLMEYAGLSFVEAVHALAQQVGMAVPEEKENIPPIERAKQQAKSLALSEIMQHACEHYRKMLRTAPQAIDYLKGRGLTGEIAARYGLGYAPAGWDGLRTVFPDYEAGTLEESGLVISKNEAPGTNSKRYDRFRDRIMFPIRNNKGQTIGFGGRVMGNGEPKYLNSPETALFHKGSELYGLFEARQAIREAGYVLVTEGYMDVLALAQLGFPQTIATLGTACTPTHVQKLLRQTDCVIFCFDGDKAGQRAARRAMEASLPFAADNKTIKFLFLPAEHDPDSFIRANGAKVFEQAVADASPLSQFLLQAVSEGNDLNSPEGRAKMQFVAKPLIKLMPATALRMQILRSLAQLAQVSPAELEAAFELSKPANNKRKAPARQKRTQPIGLERQTIRALLACPALAYELDEEATGVITRLATGHASMMTQLLETILSIGEEVRFATLSEQLRQTGPDFDSLISEIAASRDFDPEPTQQELLDAIRRIRVNEIREELQKLTSETANNAMPLEELRERHQILTQQQKELQRQIAQSTQ